jgi:hypothetical protein
MPARCQRVPLASQAPLTFISDVPVGKLVETSGREQICASIWVIPKASVICVEGSTKISIMCRNLTLSVCDTVPTKWTRSAIPSDSASSLFTRVTACTLALSPIRDTHSEGFSYFVTFIAAPAASGWSVRRVGLAPTGKRRLVTARARFGHAASPVWRPEIGVSFPAARGHVMKKAADAGGTRRTCEGRCREMVADHQGAGIKAE